MISSASLLANGDGSGCAVQYHLDCRRRGFEMAFRERVKETPENLLEFSFHHFPNGSSMDLSANVMIASFQN